MTIISNLRVHFIKASSSSSSSSSSSIPTSSSSVRSSTSVTSSTSVPSSSSSSKEVCAYDDGKDYTGQEDSPLNVTPEDNDVWTNEGLVTDEDIEIETEVKTTQLLSSFVCGHKFLLDCTWNRFECK